MQETETFTVRLPGGRTIARPVPVGASEAQIREAFRAPLARAGYDVNRSPILPRQQPAQQRTQPRPPARDPSNPTPNALLREYRPTWGQWIGDGVNALAEPLFGTTVANRMREEVGYVPFLGDAYFAGEGVSNIGAGNTFTGLGQIGLAAVGAVPVVGDAAAAGIRGGARHVGGMFGGRGIRAYHGSPHDFDRFSLAHVGTGEGAQSYGRGLYFAENQEVARQYQNVLGYKHTNGAPAVNWDDPASVAGYWVNWHGGDVAAAREHLQRMYASNLRAQPRGDHSVTRAAAEHLSAGRSPAPSPNPGYIYEVNINADPARMLDWDRPLADQRHARGLIDRYMADTEQARIAMHNSLGSASPYRSISEATTGFRPPSTVNQLALQAGDRLPQMSLDAGIPGIRYLDQGSRSAGQGSHNYVIFDDSLIDILRKY